MQRSSLRGRRLFLGRFLRSLEPTTGCALEDVVESRIVELQSLDLDPGLIQSHRYRRNPTRSTGQSDGHVSRCVRSGLTEIKQQGLDVQPILVRRQ